MTIADWLVTAMVKLKKAEVPNGRRDAIILLSDLLQADKSWVHTHPEHPLTENQVRQLNYRIKKRTQRIPLAYIRNFQEFYGRPFRINQHVLVPRPESESFIALLREIDIEMPWIADIGTGSGCLGITAALEFPEASVHLYDLSPDALSVARGNARRLGARVHAYQSNLLDDLRNISYDILLANLPYVPEELITSPEITKEPSIALFSGKDGLNHYKTFWQQVGSLQKKPQYILTESLENQHTAISKMAESAGYKLSDSDVLVQSYVKR